MTYKTILKGFSGSFLFGLIAALVWFLFSFFGTVGYWSAPVFALLIPFGFKLFSKERPITVPSFVVMGASLIITILIGAYSGNIINIYALLLNYGYSLDTISFSDASRYFFDMFRDNPNNFRIDVLLEIGIGLVLSAVIGYFVVRKYVKGGKSDER